MKRSSSWMTWMSLALIAASVVTYFIHFLIFRDGHHIFVYLIGDIAFLFINVLMVTLVIERLLNRREKNVLMKKLNMVIGTFYSEVGLELMNRFRVFVSNAPDLCGHLEIRPAWTKKDFQASGRKRWLSMAAGSCSESALTFPSGSMTVSRAPIFFPCSRRNASRSGRRSRSR